MTLNECKPFDEEDRGQETKSHKIVDRTLFAENREDSGITTTSSTSSLWSTRSSKSSKSRGSSSQESISVTSIEVMKDARQAYQDNIYSISKSSYMIMGGGQDAVDNTHTNNEPSLIDTNPQAQEEVRPSMNNADVFEGLKSSETVESNTYRDLSLDEVPPPPVPKDTPCPKKTSSSMPAEPKSCREMSLDDAPPPPVHKDTPRPKKTSFMSKLSPKVFIRKSKRAENGLTESTPAIVSTINEDEVAVSDLQHKGVDVESLTNAPAFPSNSIPDVALSTATTNDDTNIIISETLVREQSKCSVLTEETTESSSNGKLKDDNQTKAFDGGIPSSSSQENYIVALLGKLLAPCQCNKDCAGILESERAGTRTGDVPLCSSDGLFYTDLSSPSPSSIQSIVDRCSFGGIFTVASAAEESSLLKHDADESLAVEAYTDIGIGSQNTRIGFSDQEITVQPSVDEIDKDKSRMMKYPHIRNLFRKR